MSNKARETALDLGDEGSDDGFGNPVDGASSEDGEENSDPGGFDDGAWDTDGEGDSDGGGEKSDGGGDSDSSHSRGRDRYENAYDSGNDSFSGQQFPASAPRNSSDYDTDNSFNQHRPQGLRGGLISQPSPSESDASLQQQDRKPTGVRGGFQSFPSDSESSVSQTASRPQGLRGGFVNSELSSPEKEPAPLDVVPDVESDEESSENSSSKSNHSETVPPGESGGGKAAAKKGGFLGWLSKDKSDTDAGKMKNEHDNDHDGEQAVDATSETENKGGWFVGWGQNKEEDQQHGSNSQEGDGEKSSDNVVPTGPISPSEEEGESHSPSGSFGAPDESANKDEAFEDEHSERSRPESLSSSRKGESKDRGGWFRGNSQNEGELQNYDATDQPNTGYDAGDNDHDRIPHRWDTGDVEKARLEEPFEDEDEELDTKSRGTTKSYYSSIESTRERKVITCLVLCLCLLCLLIAIGLGVGIGYAVGKEEDEQNDFVQSTTPPIGLSTTSPVPSQFPTTSSPIENPTTTSPSPAPSTMDPTTSSPSTDAPATSAPTTAAPDTPQPSTLDPTSFSPVTTEPPTIGIDPLLQLIIDNSFDGGAAVQAAGTPQNTAYEWLSDNLFLDDYSGDRKLARYALATFFYSTNGPTTWDAKIRDGGWVTDAPECEWASTANNQCSNGEYRSLTLDFAGVTGQIPLEISMLTTLERFSVRGNGPGTPTLTGSIPDTIGELTNMQTVRLNDNEIGGTIPTSIGLLTNAQVLLFSGNSIGGNIPSELGTIKGGTLAFDGNELSGRIPTQIFGLSTLTTINFERNFLTGPIPTEVGNLGNLNLLDLSSNDLSGFIPTTVGLLTAVRGGIDLSDNSLIGVLPSEIGFLASMRSFEVQDNDLTGTVPLEYSSLSELRLFRIDGNPAINGVMPEAMCDVFNDNPWTTSYADCAISFECSCCTFCCTRFLCSCNTDDTTLCNT